MKPEMKAIFRFSFEDRKGFVEVIEGDVPRWIGDQQEETRPGIFGVEPFLRQVALGGYDGANKDAAILTLNTWFWVGIVGQDGILRKQFTVRHTMPDFTPAVWELWQREESREGGGSKFIWTIRHHK